MSKVGESIIQGAIEALDIAQGKNRDSMAHIPNSSDSSSKIIKKSHTRSPTKTLTNKNR